MILRTNVRDVRDAEDERDRLSGLEQVESNALVEEVAEAVDLVGELVRVDLGVVVELREARVQHLADERELVGDALAVGLPHFELLALDARVVEREQRLDGHGALVDVLDDERRALEQALEAVPLVHRGVVRQVVRAVHEPAPLEPRGDHAARLVRQQVDGAEQALGADLPRLRLEPAEQSGEDVVVLDELGEAEQEVPAAELRVELRVRVRRRPGDDVLAVEHAEEFDLAVTEVRRLARRRSRGSAAGAAG